MPTISMFYGIIIAMFQEDKVQHNKPHLHVKYAEYSAVYDLEGDLLAGKLPKKQARQVEIWIGLHKADLKTNWALIQAGEAHYKIEPLK